MRSIASRSRALPSAERWDRPRTRVSMRDGFQPGGFAQGPDEKCGRAGNVAGFGRRKVAPAAVVSVNSTLLAESTRRVGTAWPVDGCNGEYGLRKALEIIARCESATSDSLASSSLRGVETTFHRSERTTRPAEGNARLNSLTGRGQSPFRQRVVGKLCWQVGAGELLNRWLRTVLSRGPRTVWSEGTW